MEKKKYRLIATDFDGTLLNQKKELSKKNQDTLKKYQQEGYLIVGVTARTLNSVKKALPISLFDYLLLVNGTYFYDVKKEEGKEIATLSLDVVSSLLSKIDSYAKRITLCSTMESFVWKGDFSPSISKVGITSLEEIKTPVLGILVDLYEEEKIGYLESLLVKEKNSISTTVMHSSRALPDSLFIGPKLTSKKDSLVYLGKMMSIPLEEMIFFGDTENDLESIQSVGCGVAMGNAKSEVKEKAKYVTLSNDEDGISSFLDSFLS